MGGHHHHTKPATMHATGNGAGMHTFRASGSPVAAPSAPRCHLQIHVPTTFTVQLQYSGALN